MRFTSLVAFRYLRSSRNDKFFSWISFLTTLGIALGVGVLIVVISVFSAFEGELRERFLAANAHILLFSYPKGLNNYEKYQASLEKTLANEYTGIAPFIHFNTMGRKDYSVHSIIIRGIDPKKREKVQSIKDIVKPSFALSKLQEELDEFKRTKKLPQQASIILGSGLAKSMEAKLGDVVELISPHLKKKQNINEMKSFHVIGIYDSGLQHYDTRLALLSLPAAQNLFHLGKTVTGIEIGLKKPWDSKKIKEKLEERYDLTIKEWQSYNPHTFSAMQTEKAVISLIVALVAFVAAFNILTTLFVSVAQKQKDFAILRALGASRKMILKIVVKQSSFIGLIGVLLGVILALFSSWLLTRISLSDLPSVYMLRKLPIDYDLLTYLKISCFGIIISMCAGLYPAWSACKSSPTLGLREADDK